MEFLPLRNLQDFFKMSIELSPEQLKVYNATITLCLSIEKEMLTTVQPDNASEVQAQLANLLPYLSNCSVMMSTATAVHSWAKGEAAAEAMDKEKVYSAKADVQRKWFSGRLAKYDAFYSRVETLEKALRQQIEGLRSLLSYNKEMANLEKFGGGNQ